MLPLKQQRKVNLDEVDVQCEEKNKTLSVDELKEFTQDILKISHSSKSKSVLAQIKFDSKQKKFVERVSSILEKFNKIQPDDDKKLEVLFLFVMQSASDILGADESSDEICLDLLKQFTNGDDYLTKNVMNLVKQKVKPMTIYRKYKHRMYRFFSMLLGMFLKIK